MRLAIFCSDILYCNGKEYTTNTMVIREFASFADYFDSVDLCAPVVESELQGRATFQPPIFALGYFAVS